MGWSALLCKREEVTHRLRAICWSLYVSIQFFCCGVVLRKGSRSRPKVATVLGSVPIICFMYTLSLIVYRVEQAEWGCGCRCLGERRRASLQRSSKGKRSSNHRLHWCSGYQGRISARFRPLTVKANQLYIVWNDPACFEKFLLMIRSIISWAELIAATLRMRKSTYEAKKH